MLTEFEGHRSAVTQLAGSFDEDILNRRGTASGSEVSVRASTLDELGQDRQAEEHWQKFLMLSPDSPWASEARERLS